MRKVVLICVAACVAMLAAGVATASAAEVSSHSFAGQSSQDSSTCGGNWANDTYTRVFKTYVHQNNNGTYRVVENFTHGRFQTIQGPSAESCEAGDSNQVSGGVHGNFHGSYILIVSNGSYSSTDAGNWDGNGGTAGYIAAAFGGGASYTTEDFYFYYTTKSHLACANTWTNASTGNGGDIATICS